MRRRKISDATTMLASSSSSSSFNALTSPTWKIHRLSTILLLLLVLHTTAFSTTGRPFSFSIPSTIYSLRQEPFRWKSTSFPISSRAGSTVSQGPGFMHLSVNSKSTSVLQYRYMPQNRSVLSMTAQNYNEDSSVLQQHQLPWRRRILPVGTTIILSALVIFWKRNAISSLLNYIKTEWLLVSLDRLNAAGLKGYLLYMIAFLIWEMTVGVTTPIETAAGAAFGRMPSIVASGSAKFIGALLTFGLARYRFKGIVTKKLKGKKKSKNNAMIIEDDKETSTNELLSLMEESITETPFKVALLSRFAPLPEYVKNAGMGILELPKRWFVLSLLIHGFSFTCLWSCVGAESVQVLRGQINNNNSVVVPSSTLRWLLTGATWIGCGAPIYIGFWIKGLRAKRDSTKERTGEKNENTHDDDN